VAETTPVSFPEKASESEALQKKIERSFPPKSS